MRDVYSNNDMISSYLLKKKRKVLKIANDDESNESY